MKAFIKSWFMVLALLNLSLDAALAQEVAVIVNPEYAGGELDDRQIEQIFMGRLTTLSPYDLPDSSPVKERFYARGLGKSMQQINSARAKLIFSGRGRAPEQLVNSRAVKSVVAGNPKAIGYIDKSAVDDTVQVIKIIDGGG